MAKLVQLNMECTVNSVQWTHAVTRGHMWRRQNSELWAWGSGRRERGIRTGMLRAVYSSSPLLIRSGRFKYLYFTIFNIFYYRLYLKMSFLIFVFFPKPKLPTFYLNTYSKNIPVDTVANISELNFLNFSRPTPLFLQTFWVVLFLLLWQGLDWLR